MGLTSRFLLVGYGMVSLMVGTEGTEQCVLTIRSCFFEEVHEAERVSVRRDQSTGVRTGGVLECRDHGRLVSLH